MRPKFTISFGQLAKFGITLGNGEQNLHEESAVVTNHRQDRSVDQIAEVNEMLSTPRLLRRM